MAVDTETGYWTVSIAPLPLEEKRFPLTRLIDRVENTSVALRGWNYPHVPREPNAISYGPGYVEGHESWAQYQETFRFHTTGLFVHRWQMREDGTQYRGTIHFVAAIYSVAEIWEFSRRLYGEDESVQEVRLTIRLENVLDRPGSGDSFVDLPYGQRARRNWFDVRRTVSRLELRAGVAALAAETSIALFLELGYTAISESFVQDKTNAFLAGRL